MPRVDYKNKDRTGGKEVGKERSSNLELLRVLCILFIVADHATGQTGIFRTTDGLGLTFCYTSLLSLSKVACSVFVIISSWFLSQMEFRLKKVLHVWLTVFMYTMPVLVFLHYKGIVSKWDLRLAFFPMEEGPLWFANHYMALLLIMPLLNTVLHKTTKNVLAYFLGFMFILSSVYPTLTLSNGFFGSEFWAMILLYMLTGYIRKYKDALPSSKKSFLVFGLVWFLLVAARTLSTVYFEKAPYVCLHIQTFCEIFRIRMQSIPNLVLAYSLFFGFKGLNIKHSKFINTLASTTLGVYVYHQIPIFLGLVWTKIYRADHYSQTLEGYKRIVYVLCVVFLVWTIGVILELIRNKVSIFLIESRDFYNNYCNKIDAFVNDTTGEAKLDRKLIIGTVIVISIYMVATYLYFREATLHNVFGSFF